ncbi:MAG: hypothetical protein ACYTAF_03760 [Planctomycetota bacterium]|jgi:hypothetical protein
MNAVTEKGNGPGPFAVRHAEKIGFAAAAAALALYLVLGVLLAGEDTLAASTREKIDEARNRLAGPNEPLPEREDWRGAALTAYREIPQAPGAADDWGVSYPTEAWPRTPIERRKLPPVVANIASFDAAVSLYRIRLEWSFEEIKDGRKEAPIEHVRVERVPRWKEGARLIPAGTTSFDDDVDPEESYAYTVTPVKPDEKLEGGAGKTIAVETPTPYRFTVRGFLEGKVMLYVTKELKDGSTPNRVVTRAPGEEVGLETGLRIGSATPTVVKLDRLVCKRYWDEWKWTCDGPEVKKVDFPTTRVEITDRKGTRRAIHFPKPRVRHRLCRDHERMED